MSEAGAYMTERSHKKVDLQTCFSEKVWHNAICSPKGAKTKNQKMKTKASVQTEIHELTRILAGYVSRLTTERSTLSEDESALLSARANETMLRLLVLQSEVQG